MTHPSEKPADSTSISGLSGDERAALARRLLGGRRKVARIGRVVRDGSPKDVSFAQARQLFIWSFGRKSPRYNLPILRRLKGRLDAGVLERSVRELIRRHETLRTTFSVDGDDPTQIVQSEAAAEGPGLFELVDLRATSAEEAETTARRLVAEESHTAIQLDSELPIRVTLYALGPEEHLLLLKVHHVAADGWSGGILLRELPEIYAAFLAGRPSPFPEPELQYVDFAVWQRQPDVQAQLDAHLAYWKTALAGIVPLDLPSEGRRPAVKRHRGSRVSFELPAVSARVDELARRERTTSFMVFLATFDALLSRWSGRDDIVVGVPVAGRNRTELESIVGMFVNTVPLRTSLTGNPSFRELLGRVREASLAAFSHQDAPFERIVEAVNPPRDLSRTPIFEAMFTFHNLPPADSRWPGIAVTDEVAEHEVALVDLSLDLVEEEGRCRARFEFDTDLFDRAAIERMAAHFGRLLASALDDPDAPIATLPMMDDAERDKVVREWNLSGGEPPSDTTFDSLFEAQVARSPEALAAQCDGDRATYAQLSARAHRAAKLLQAHGLRRGAIVGILATRSVDFLAAILGASKLGVAYLPLDPKHPAQRIAAVLEQSKVTHVISETSLVGTMKEALSHTKKPATILDLPSGPTP